MSSFKNQDTGRLERSIYEQTPKLDAEAREAGMRAQFLKAAKYLDKRGYDLAILLKEALK